MTISLGAIRLRLLLLSLLMFGIWRKCIGCNELVTERGRVSSSYETEQKVAAVIGIGRRT